MSLCRPTTNWYLRLVGEVAVSSTTGAWQARDVGSRKARTLLALLGARDGHLVAVDHVVDALWGNTPPRDPEANVATLVSRLRSRFGPEVIIGGRTGYRLGDTVSVDLHDAAALIAKAENSLNGSQPAHALLVAEQVMKLLDGAPVLAGHPTAEWAERARATQETLLRRAWHVAAESSLRTGAPGLAQALAETAIAADPLDEPAYRVLMRACVANGEPARAVIAYQRLRTTLAAELGVGPAIATRDMHSTILRANTATG